MNSYAVLYAKDLPYFGRLEAQFIWDMPSEATLSSNYGDRQEIGTYAMTVPPDEVAALKNQLLSPDFRTLPPPAPSQSPHMPGMPPDMPSLSVGLWDINQELPEVKGFYLGQIPSSLDPALAALEKHVDVVLKHPKHVISGIALWDAAQVKVGDELLFSATLKNIGTESLRIGAPGFPDAETGKLPWTLNLVRIPPAGAKGEPPAESPAFMSLTPDNLRGDSSRKRFWSKDIATLDRGEAIVVTLKKKLHLTPGKYQATLIFVSNPDKERDDHVGGTLRLQLPTLKVVSP